MLVWENCNMEAYTPKHGIFGQDAFVCLWLCEQHKLKDFESYKNNFRNPQEVKAQNTWELVLSSNWKQTNKKHE